MEERRKRTPKKPEHPIREWISDYLRYFELFGGILVLLLIAGVAIKMLSGRTSGAASSSADTQAESVTVTKSTDTDVSDKDQTVAASTETTPTLTPEASEDTEESAASDMTKEADSGVITTLINTYFEGLSAKDPQIVESCVDSFTEEDSQQVAGNTQITSYSDVNVYTCDGIDDKSRVAFVTYNYTVNGSDIKIPALTEFYVYDTGSGDWRLASDTSSDTTIQQKIDELTQTEAVQTMISDVQKEYDQVMSEHPELQ